MVFSPLKRNNTGAVTHLAGGTMSRHRLQCSSWLACSLLLTAILLGATSALAAGPASQVLDEARRLIADGRAADAHRLLAPHELELAGEPLFDYLFGIAALDSGRASDAIPAFERVLAGNPESASARLELGRALYETGDRAAARRQLNWLLSHDPPPSVQRTAEAYLRSMDGPARAAGGWSRTFEFGGGYDTNANASTNERTFLGIVLDPGNVETPSAFLNASFSLGNVRPVGASSRAVTVARIGHRWNADAGFVDQTIATLDTTFDIGDGPTILSLGIGGHYGLLDGESHQWGAGADLAVTHRFDSDWLARGMLRMGTLRYDSHFGSLSVLDADRYLAAFSLQRAHDGRGLGFTAFAGKDDPRVSGSAFANERLGMQFSASSRNGAGNGLQLQVAYQAVNYDNQPGFFLGIDRSDQVMSATVLGEITDWPAKGFNLLPRVSWVTNDSNISLYEYVRFEFGLTMQRSF
jgi:outer membrane protein